MYKPPSTKHAIHPTIVVHVQGDWPVIFSTTQSTGPTIRKIPSKISVTRGQFRGVLPGGDRKSHAVAVAAPSRNCSGLSLITPLYGAAYRGVSVGGLGRRT